MVFASRGQLLATIGTAECVVISQPDAQVTRNQKMLTYHESYEAATNSEGMVELWLGR